MVDPVKTSHIYSAKFGCCFSECVRMQEVPKILETLGLQPLGWWGRGWTPIYINLHFYLLTQETCFSFTRVTMPNNAKFSHSRSNHMSEIMEIHQKNWPLRRAFQRHSTSVELTRINRQPRTSYFIPFPRNTAILVKKIAHFSPPPVYLTSILREFPLEFCNGGSARKN